MNGRTNVRSNCSTVVHRSSVAQRRVTSRTENLALRVWKCGSIGYCRPTPFYWSMIRVKPGCVGRCQASARIISCLGVGKKRKAHRPAIGFVLQIRSKTSARLTFRTSKRVKHFTNGLLYCTGRLGPRLGVGVPSNVLAYPNVQTPVVLLRLLVLEGHDNVEVALLWDSFDCSSQTLSPLHHFCIQLMVRLDRQMISVFIPLLGDNRSLEH